MIKKEQLLDLFEYDNGELRWKKSRQGVSAGSIVGCGNGFGYKTTKIDGVRYRVHRLIFMMFHGFMPETVDHINGDTADNRIENLRAATRTQNQQNRTKPITGKNPSKNVYLDKHSSKWRVSFKLNGKQRSFGSYDDLDFAELVAIEARNKLHGAFANHKVTK